MGLLASMGFRAEARKTLKCCFVMLLLVTQPESTLGGRGPGTCFGWCECKARAAPLEGGVG